MHASNFYDVKRGRDRSYKMPQAHLMSFNTPLFSGLTMCMANCKLNAKDEPGTDS